MISYKSVIEKFTKIAWNYVFFNSYFVTSPNFFNFLRINSLRAPQNTVVCETFTDQKLTGFWIFLEIFK